MDQKISICPVTRLEIVESSRWQDLHLNKRYTISIRKIGKQIIDVHGRGLMSEFSADKFHKMLAAFIEDQDIEFPFVEMRCYRDVRGMMASKKTIIRQKDLLIEEADKRIGFLTYEAPSTMSYLLKSGKRRYENVSVSVGAYGDYETAVRRALEILDQPRYEYYKHHQKDRQVKLQHQDLEALIAFSGQFLWEDDISNKVDVDFGSDHPLYPLLENLLLVKETILNVEDDVIKKSKALAQEQIQMAKIVEALETSVIILDPGTGGIVSVNPAGRALLKGDQNSLEGHKYSDFMVGEISEADNKWMIRDLNGETIPVLRKRVKIQLNHEDYILENLVDIQETQKYEDQLKLALEETEKINIFAINREKRIIEMKKEVNALLKDLGQAIKYSSVE